MNLGKAPTLRKNLDLIKKIILEKDYDWIHLIIGKEGTGKSTLGLQVCKYFDETFDESRIINDLEELKVTVRNSKPGQAIMIDEGALFFYASDAMTKDVKEIIKLFTAFRKYNLFFVICVPQYYDIVSRIRDKRVKSATVVYKRGVFGFMSRAKLNRIYKNKINNQEVYPTPNFIERYDALDNDLWRRYLAKKTEILESRTQSKYISSKEAARILGIAYPTLMLWLNKKEIPYDIIHGKRKIKKEDVMKMKKQMLPK